MIVESSGTQTAVISTEHTLASPATAKTRVLLVDVSALIATEVLELRFKGPVLSAGSTQLIKLQTYTGVVAEPFTQSMPFLMPQGGSVTLKQTSGTGRAFPWAICTLD
jgi:hypothetical protein